MEPRSGARDIAGDKEKSPRVNAVVVVFDYGAMKGLEIPFVIGVVGDLSGKRKAALPPVDKRNFVDIDSGEFNTVMRAARPRVAFPVPNQMSSQEGDLMIDLEFESVDDFTPERVARKVEPLRLLLEERDRLKSLAGHIDGNADGVKAVEKLLAEVEKKTSKPAE